MTSMDADLRSGRRLETGRRSESIIYMYFPLSHELKFVCFKLFQTC